MVCFVCFICVFLSWFNLVHIIADQLREPYDTHMKSRKWWFAVMCMLFDVCICNSYILYKKAMLIRDPYINMRKDIMSHLEFRRQLAEDLLVDYFTEQDQGDVVHKRVKRINSLDDLPGYRLYGRCHWLERHECASKAGNPSNRRCVWCRLYYKKESRTLYRCKFCLINLCFLECFYEFHTMKL